MPAPLDFPPNPAVGQTHPVPSVPGQPVYTFDGEKWTTLGLVTAIGGTQIGPSVSIPLPNAGAGSPGSEGAWSRGDHVHPSDTSVTAAVTVLVTRVNELNERIKALEKS